MGRNGCGGVQLTGSEVRGAGRAGSKLDKDGETNVREILRYIQAQLGVWI